MGVERKPVYLSQVVAMLSIVQTCSVIALVYLFITVNNLQLRLISQEGKVQQSQESKEAQHNVGLFHSTGAPPSDEHIYTASRMKRQVTSSQCGGKFLIDRFTPNTYRIQSPNYPLNYPPNTICHWEFILNFPEPRGYAGSSGVTNGASLTVTFHNISLEAHSNCLYDAVEVRGGSENGPVLARYCGVNRDVPAINFTGPVHILFKSDQFVSGTGFLAEIRVNEEMQSFPGPAEPVPSEKGDTTYTRWGKPTCLEGTPFYDGYAFGIGKSDVLECVPHPVDIQFATANISASAPRLTAARFDINNINGGLSVALNDKPIRCALCHVKQTTAFMVIGWRNCHDLNWTTAYTGYLMTVWSGDRNSPSSAEPICMDKSPVVSDGYGIDRSAPKLSYVKSGTGLWIENKLVPCTVCIRSV